jgi:hypothetical protein
MQIAKLLVDSTRHWGTESCHRAEKTWTYFVRSTVLKSDCVTDFLTKVDAHLLADTLSHRHGSNATRLCASNHTFLCVPSLVQVLSKLCRLAGSRF